MSFTDWAYLVWGGLILGTVVIYGLYKLAKASIKWLNYIK